MASAAIRAVTSGHDHHDSDGARDPGPSRLVSGVAGSIL
jgi:hypothetical protein